jgi:tRNA G18 (ribose-2'-O)-methylase SpoU
MALEPPIDLPADEVRALLAPIRNGLSIAIVAAGNAFAVGAIVRVAHSFLVREIVLVGSETFYEKASMGMHRFERIVRVADEAALLAHVGARPIWAFEREAATGSLHDPEPWPEDVVLLFGSERGGVPPALLARAARTVAIPMHGINHSLPLAVAVGIALAEFARRRYAPGALVVGPPRQLGERSEPTT